MDGKAKKLACNEHDHEEPAVHSPPEAESFAEPRTFDGHSCALKHEVDCGKTITCASGQRNYQVVYQPRHHEYQEASRLCT